MQMKPPTSWQTIAFLMLLLALMLLIIKKYNEQNELQKKIYYRSGITDTIYK